jgi:hypothetical protein
MAESTTRIGEKQNGHAIVIVDVRELDIVTCTLVKQPLLGKGRINTQQ